MPSVQVDTPHPHLTARRNLQYMFTPKHHGASATASCWLTAIAFDEEFAIFNRADGMVVALLGDDDQQVADPAGNLYGYEVMGASNQHLRELGTWDQQMAEYPVQKAGAAWHGYPIWPINPIATPPRFQGQRCRPLPDVFRRMEQLGHITASHRKRLMKGDFT